MSKTYILTLSGLLFLYCSCKKGDPLGGIDKNALFASPTAAELDVIKTEWRNRDLTPTDITIEETHAITNRLNFKLISFRASGFKQYAAVLLPITTTPLPIRFCITGFALKDPVSYLNIKTSPDADTLPFIYVIPALRGQSLNITVNNTLYKSPVSEGTTNDAFDGASDDAISTLNAIAITFKADTSKVMVQGGSRGGTVALLMAERDDRVKLAVGIAFPSELLTLTASHQNDPTYKFQFLSGLISGTVSLTEARKKLIASSPVYFCELLPKTQIHFGDKDDITPVAEGEKLFNAMKNVGNQDSIEFFIYNGRKHQDIGNNNPEMNERIEKFFRL